ncbi:MAG: dienelactone hydrolase family protein [Desulfuromonadales bacterium]|nr:dienelactone hydrolase family protein [Desulfuromonadales bacterium]
MYRIAFHICLVAITFYLSGCAESLKVKSYSPRPEIGDVISGTIVKPDGEGPFPGIIILHGCAGITDNDYQWSRRLKSWGYASLILNSLGSRGVADNCGYPKKILVLERALDAHAAKVQFGNLPFVDRNRIGVLGYSEGGMTVLESVQFNLVEYSLPEEARDPFKAAVALYPWCNKKVGANTNLMILIGEKDDWTPANLCQENLPTVHFPEDEIALKIYPGAYHKFDENKRDRVSRGHFLSYSASAMNDAVPRVRTFLEKHVKSE